MSSRCPLYSTITRVEYFIGPARLVVPSAFMTGTCIDLGSSSRCIRKDLAFFSLMKHMWAPLFNRATMVSFCNGCTFQMRVTGISISFTPRALNCGTVCFFFSRFSGICFVVLVAPVQGQACSLQAHLAVHDSQGTTVLVQRQLRQQKCSFGDGDPVLTRSR